MGVDPEYIEEVKENNYESVLEDFGIEASYEQSGNGVDLTGYTQTVLRDMYDKEEYFGRPQLTDVYVVEFKNKKTGETTVNHKIDLILLDDSYEDEKEAYIFPINLTSDNIDFDKGIVKNVYSSSGLYALAMGLMELRAPNISRAYNHLDVVGIKKLQKQVAAYSELGVRVVEKSFVHKVTKEEQYYNSFRIFEGKE